MKKLTVLSFVIVIVTLFNISCSNNQKPISAKSIIGKWQNNSVPNNAIEFSQSGNYILWINGEVPNTLEKLKYNFDPTAKEYNLKLGYNIENDTSMNYGKIEFVDVNTMKISLYSYRLKF